MIKIYTKKELETSCIYILYKRVKLFNTENDIPIYVGQSKRGIERVLEHKDKGYDYVSIIKCPMKRLNEMEQYYIKELQPLLNRTYLSNNKKTINRCFYKNRIKEK